MGNQAILKGETTMKAYIIMTHYEASPKNTNYFGTEEAVKNYFYGKGQELLTDIYQAHKITESDAQNITHWLLTEYAYTTKASAMRGLKAQQAGAEWETAHGWWKVSCKLVEVNI